MSNPALNRIRELLEAILQGDLDREDLILELERLTNGLDERDGLPESFLMELSDFVLDLSYFEPNPVYRKEDRSYYGEEKLVQLVKSFLRRLPQVGSSV